MIILGFNSVSAADSSDVVEDSSADLSLSSSSDLEMIDDSESSSETISDESLSEPNFIDEVSDSSSNNDDLIREGSDAIYLSKDGNDDNDGSEGNPVNTIERAIQLAVSENGPHKISVGEGSYVVFGIDLDDTYLTIEGSGIDKTTFDGVGYTGPT